MKPISNNTKIILSIGHLRRLVKECCRVLESAEYEQDCPYINIPRFKNEIEGILDEAAKTLGLTDLASFYIDEYVDSIVDDTIRSIEKYVHQKDTSMSGNFANIRLDWNRNHKHGPDFKEVIDMIDAGENNEHTEEFRDWTIEWYFDAFGTYGLKYNWIAFLEEVADDSVD